MKQRLNLLKESFQRIRELAREYGWLGVMAASFLFLAPIACSTTDREMVMPPNIPGASYTGTESCTPCHEEHTRDFSDATHALVKTEWSDVGNLGCELCHGPASVHVESGGVVHTIINPAESPDACYQCHQDLRARFRLPSHHPISDDIFGTREVNCSSCHPSHKGPAIPEASSLMFGANEGCIKCHPAQRGPFAFEHEAMREGCVICHQPHGSVNPMMLTERNGNLCLKCHIDVRSSDITIGGLSHQFLMQRGTCWTAGCHEAVHGSQVSSSLRF